jgi:hypothetical protein
LTTRARGTLALGLHPTIVDLATFVDGVKHPVFRREYVIRGTIRSVILKTTFIFSFPIRKIFSGSSGRRRRSNAEVEFPAKVTLAAILFIIMHPQLLVRSHVRGSMTIILAGLIARFPICVPLSIATESGRSTATFNNVPFVMLIAFSMG